MIPFIGHNLIMIWNNKLCIIFVWSFQYKKDVKARRDYEGQLLKQYREYLEYLESVIHGEWCCLFCLIKYFTSYFVQYVKIWLVDFHSICFIMTLLAVVNHKLGKTSAESLFNWLV